MFRLILDRHPDVSVPPESHFIPVLWARRGRYGRGDLVEDQEAFLRDLGSNERFRRWDLPIEAVREELAARSPLTFASAVEATYLAYAGKAGKSRWGDKTPGYADHMSLIAGLFPEARFLHLIRDGRDVTSSVVSLGRGHRAGTAAFLWAKEVRRARKGGAELRPSRYMELRYEDLLGDLEGELRRACEFLELPFDQAMLRHDERALEKVVPEQRWMQRRIHLPPTKGLRDWRIDMTPSDIAETEAVAGKQLAASGYELTTRRTLPARVGAWLRVGAFLLRRRGRRLRRGGP
jgi:sulfotransferase family protein